MVLRKLIDYLQGWEPVKEITVSLTPKDAYFVDITCEPDHAYYLADPKSKMWTLSHNCDDGVIESDALSKDIRTKRNSEYTTNIRTRFQPGYNCAEIVIGCLTSDTQILLGDSTTKVISEIIQGDVVQTLSPSGEVELKSVKSLVPQGKDAIYLLKTRNCLPIRGNYRHPFLLESGEWKPLGELKPKDKIQYRRCQLDSIVCESSEIDEYWLLGFMFGDGWVNTSRRGDGRDRYVTQLAIGVHDDLNIKVQSIFERLFKGKWKQSSTSRSFRSDRRDVAEWFIAKGLTGLCRAHTKRVPSYVFSLPFQLREAFLDGILDADGNTVKTGGRSIEMCNRELVSDIKRLAELQGFTTGQVRERTRLIKPPSREVASEYTMYGISISGVRDTQPFGITEVVSCEKTGYEEEVFDLMVEDNHNFIANGMVVHNTQWAQGDLFDYVEDADKHSTDKWDIIKFPALLTDEASDKIRKKDDPIDAYLPGTSFWPEMYTTEQLENIRASMRNDMARWNALYMQSPTPETGAIFNAEDFRVWRDTIPPPVHTKLLVLDTAYTKGKQSDPSAYSLFGIFNRTEGGQTRPNIILLDANKGKWDFPELLRKIETLYSRKKPEYIVIEKQASGLALIPELRNRGLPIVEWRTQKDKIARAHSVSPLVKSGIFWVPMPDGDDNTAQKSMDYISTICAMSSWDLLDTFTSGLMYMRDENLLIGDNYAISEDEFYYEEDEDDYDTRGSYVGALLG